MIFEFSNIEFRMTTPRKGIFEFLKRAWLFRTSFAQKQDSKVSSLEKQIPDHLVTGHAKARPLKGSI